jgi:hypothetical protein
MTWLDDVDARLVAAKRVMVSRPEPGNDPVRASLADIGPLVARVREVEAAVAKYGEHHYSCVTAFDCQMRTCVDHWAKGKPLPCDCGFQVALDAARAGDRDA